MEPIRPIKQMSQEESGGNTNAPDSRNKNSSNQCYRWAFTLRCEPNEPGALAPANPTCRGIDAQDLWDLLKGFCKEFYFQMEEGAGGYLHYQGCFSLITKHRLSEVKNLIGFNHVHLENKILDWNALKRYCKKEDTRVAGPWDHNHNWITLIKKFRPWQQNIWDLISQPCDDNRTIWWFWEPNGNIGKTMFSKHCIVKLGANVVRSGALKDIAFSLSDKPKVIIFDIPRTVLERVNYEALEACKDGLIFSAKYESKVKIFESPHVICFANEPPEEQYLSKDRWAVVRLR